jgi:hypothetical protein
MIKLHTNYLNSLYIFEDELIVRLIYISIIQQYDLKTLIHWFLSNFTFTQKVLDRHTQVHTQYMHVLCND